MSPSFAPTARSTGTPAAISVPTRKPGNSQTIHHRARRFAAGDNKPPDARSHQPFGDVGHRLLDGVAGGVAAVTRLKGCDLVWR